MAADTTPDPGPAYVPPGAQTRSDTSGPGPAYVPPGAAPPVTGAPGPTGPGPEAPQRWPAPSADWVESWAKVLDTLGELAGLLDEFHPARPGTYPATSDALQDLEGLLRGLRTLTAWWLLDAWGSGPRHLESHRTVRINPTTRRVMEPHRLLEDWLRTTAGMDPVAAVTETVRVLAGDRPSGSSWKLRRLRDLIGRDTTDTMFTTGPLRNQRVEVRSRRPRNTVPGGRAER